MSESAKTDEAPDFDIATVPDFDVPMTFIPEASVPETPMFVADPLATFEKQGMVKVISPAKVNLFLGVGEKRNDGFHEVCTVLHSLTLHDDLHIDYEMANEGGLSVELAMYAREGLPPLEIAPEENLVYRAVHALAKRLGRNQSEKFRIRVEKHIPQQAGLGGGSSNAAAALVGAAHFWGLDTRAPEVLETASQLGSDVAFFLQGGCACFKGKGDRLSHVLEPMKLAVVLIKPEGGVSTRAAYLAFDDAPDLLVSEELVQATKARKAPEVPLRNNLAQAARSILPVLHKLQAWIAEQPEARESLLCGSGSTTFVLCDTMNDAFSLVGRARSEGWWARSCSFSSIGATMLPQRC